MQKTGVNLQIWKDTVNRASSSAENIGKVKAIKLSKTDLAPFTSFKNSIEEINNSLASYKGLAEQDAGKMIKAGANKAQDDSAGASSLKIVGGR